MLGLNTLLLTLTTTVAPLLFIPLGGLILLGISYILPSVIRLSSQRIALSITYLTFIYALMYAVTFNTLTPNYQFLLEVPYGYFLGVDSLSLYFIVLVAAIFPICILSTRSDLASPNLFFFLLLFLELFLLLAFLTTDLLFFYIAFESTLLPMLLIINIWGSRQRKKGAANYLFLYTLGGSFFMLFAIVLIYFSTGVTDLEWLFLNSNCLSEQENILWICFFIAFAVKVPIMPFHLWLPEAHVEAPTIGSIILASLLLKLGGYGLIRVCLALFPSASAFFSPIVYVLCLISVIYGSLLALRQVDIKKIIAYSSIAHMNVAILGIFVGGSLGLQGAIFLMIGHGVVAGALFFCVGVLYERYHTRLLDYYGGLTQVMPLFSLFFVFFSVVSVGFPGTCNFIGEFVILAGLFKINIGVCILVALSTVLGTGYALLLCTRICFGQLKTTYITHFSDLTRKELLILSTFAIWSVVLGVYPSIITNTTAAYTLVSSGVAFHKEIILAVLLCGVLFFNILNYKEKSRIVWSRHNHSTAQLFFLCFAFFILFVSTPTVITWTNVSNSLASSLEIWLSICIVFTLSTAALTLPQQHNSVIDYPLLILFLALFSYFFLHASNFLMLFVLIEAINIVLYVIMLLDRPRAVSRGEAVLKYYTNSVCAAGFFLLSFILILPYTDSLQFATIQSLFLTNIGLAHEQVSIVLFLFTVTFGFGLFFKLAAYPCALWAPDVYNTLTVGLLFCFAILTKLLFFTLLLLVVCLTASISGNTDLLLIVGVSSLLAGALGAIIQPTILRFYAFSSIHHVGLICITLSTGSRAAVVASAVYVLGYLFTSSVFLLILTGIKTRAGQWRRRLVGVNASPTALFPTIGLVICLLSMLGLPPLLGFFLKYYLFVVTVYSGGYFLFICAALTGVIAAYNYLTLVRTVFYPSVFTSNATHYAEHYTWFWLTDYFNKNRVLSANTFTKTFSTSPLLLWSHTLTSAGATVGTLFILGAIVILKRSFTTNKDFIILLHF